MGSSFLRRKIELFMVFLSGKCPEMIIKIKNGGKNGAGIFIKIRRDRCKRKEPL